MSTEFEPFEHDIKKRDFNPWEYQVKKEESVEVISQEEQFLQECELLRQEAAQKGYEEGWQRAEEEIQLKKGELAAWLELLQKPVQLLDEQLTQEMIQTIIWLCQHCIGVELSINPEQLGNLLNKIKEELPALAGKKKLAMHPADVDWIKAEINEKFIPDLHELLSADSSLGRGDFYLQGEHSELDGRLFTRFSTLFADYINNDNCTKPAQD